jgi:hypothetical protein
MVASATYKDLPQHIGESGIQMTWRFSNVSQTSTTVS